MEREERVSERVREGGREGGREGERNGERGGENQRSGKRGVSKGIHKRNEEEYYTHKRNEREKEVVRLYNKIRYMLHTIIHVHVHVLYVVGIYITASHLEHFSQR